MNTTLNNSQSNNSLTSETLSACQDINNVLTTSNITSPIFHTHYTNLATGKHGIAELISEILTSNGAIFPKDIANTEFRSLGIAASMYVHEIEAAVQSIFTAGSVRYPSATIKTYLAVFMLKKGIIGKIQLTSKEDCNRTSKKSRTKYFLVQK
jgi:hypothetical protein